MPLSLRQGGSWRTAQSLWLRQGGAWRPIQNMWLRQGGAWRPFYANFQIVTPSSGMQVTDGAGETGSAASFTVGSNGTLSGNGSVSVVLDSNWGTPTTAGIGAEYELQTDGAVSGAGTLSGQTGGAAWQSISVNRTVTLSSGVGQSASAPVTVRIREAATSTVVYETTITLGTTA